MALSRLDPSEPGGIPNALPAKPVYFAGWIIGRARTLSGAAMLANEYGASVRTNSPHDGPDVVIEGPDRFVIESKVTS